MVTIPDFRGELNDAGTRHVTRETQARPYTATELVAALEQLLRFIHRLSPPLNTRPALFLEQKDALGGMVVAMIKRMGGKPPSSTSFSARSEDTGAAFVRRPGRRPIPIERHSQRS